MKYLGRVGAVVGVVAGVMLPISQGAIKRVPGRLTCPHLLKDLEL